MSFKSAVAAIQPTKGVSQDKMHTIQGPFSREATISRLDLSDFSICILGYSRNRLISFDSRRINKERPYSL